VIHASYLEQQYMQEMVEARKSGDKVEERHDLFSGLLDAAQDEPDNGAGLSDEELIGWYSTLQSFGILGKRLTLPPRKHVHISYRWTRGWIFPSSRGVASKKAFPCRPQRIPYALHSPCWLSTLMNKSACINTSKGLCPA
jgi:hypothetical protein